MSPEWQKLQPGYGLGSAMKVSTHSLSTTRKLISNNLRLRIMIQTILNELAPWQS